MRKRFPCLGNGQAPCGVKCLLEYFLGSSETWCRGILYGELIIVVFGPGVFLGKGYQAWVNVTLTCGHGRAV